MFGFGKKAAKTPEERLSDCQHRQDWAGVAKACYEMGVSAMEQGDLNRAQLWLHRADTIYSADDGTYEAVGDQLIDDCSDRIGQLEGEEALLYNAVPAQIEEKAGELGDPQVRVWGLLSAARLVKLGQRLSALPGCEVLGELGWAVDMMLNSFQAPPSQEEYQHLMDICNALYELNGRPVYYSGEIPVPGKAAFQVFDLNGMFGVEQDLNSYIDSHLRLLAALSQNAEELPTGELDVVGCTLLPDYCVRTLGGKPEDAPQVQAELARIWSDFEFVRAGFTWEDASKRIDQYKALDLLA